MHFHFISFKWFTHIASNCSAMCIYCLKFISYWCVFALFCSLVCSCVCFAPRLWRNDIMLRKDSKTHLTWYLAKKKTSLTFPQEKNKYWQWFLTILKNLKYFCLCDFYTSNINVGYMWVYIRYGKYDISAHRLNRRIKKHKLNPFMLHFLHSVLIRLNIDSSASSSINTFELVLVSGSVHIMHKCKLCHHSYS